MSKRTTPAELAEEAALLRHRPGTAGHDLALWLAAEKRRDQAKSRAKKHKKLTPPLMSKEEAEAAATHLLKSSHGQVKALNALFKYHVAEGQPSQPAQPAPVVKQSAIDAALESGRRWREAKKYAPQRSASGYTPEEVRRGRLEMYGEGRAETSGGPGHPGRRT